jgi:broad-specificity NMP kinase
MKARENPFRAEKVVALEFHPQGTTLEELWRNIDAMGWHGALVGPCGTGKTTLLETLKSKLESDGKSVVYLRFDVNQRKLRLDKHCGQDALLVDGVEQLSWIDRHRLARFGRQFPIFVVTSHHPTFLPVWVLAKTSPQLLQVLCERLGVTISEEKAANLWKKHAGNVRFSLGELYDQEIFKNFKKSP